MVARARHLGGRWPTNLVPELDRDRARFAEVAASYGEAHRVCSTAIHWVRELDGVIFPEANRTDVKGTRWWFGQCQIPAAGARILRPYLSHGSPLCEFVEVVLGPLGRAE